MSGLRWTLAKTMRFNDKRGFKKTTTVIPINYKVYCYLCQKNTRSLRIYCKKCRYDLHYGRRVDAYGNKYIEYEAYINDPHYD